MDESFFYLKRADTLLGVLELCGGDFPWHECKFEPTAAFEEIRPLLEYITPLIEYISPKQSEALGLRLVRILNGEEINYFDFGLNIHGHEAKLRFGAFHLKPCPLSGLGAVAAVRDAMWKRLLGAGAGAIARSGLEKRSQPRNTVERGR